MKSAHLSARVANVFLAALLWPWLSSAAPEEIQVYMGEINRPGEFGLDLHTNYVLTGVQEPEFPGAQISAQRYRLTPEASYGLTENWELGVYFPLLSRMPGESPTLQGAKVRMKYLAPRPTDGSHWWGLNLEVGRTSRQLDINPWNGELKGIAGAKWDRWTLATNVNLDFAISGPHPGAATLNIDTKAAFALNGDWQVGIESYDDLGAASHPGRLSDQAHVLYAVADTHVGRWDLNVGLGRGFGSSQDHWVVKAIIGMPIGR